MRVRNYFYNFLKTNTEETYLELKRITHYHIHNDIEGGHQPNGAKKVTRSDHGADGFHDSRMFGAAKARNILQKIYGSLGKARL